ncbi:PadR family transcriptional regulator [Streptomyces sp. 5-8]|uniref:PadR family transcriptional regulator n=1 Tax=Streptomyces musisoli TaxID=2802280 RepID=A0ABS1NWA3_9ACTN|nr:PadR family transcriptional regulator [Streptomyces musisoli]
MALRHVAPTALLERDLRNYELAKSLDLGVANFRHAHPQQGKQVHAELTRLEKDGLIAGGGVLQEARPDKRLFRATDAGLAELVDPIRAVRRSRRRVGVSWSALAVEVTPARAPAGVPARHDQSLRHFLYRNYSHPVRR